MKKLILILLLLFVVGCKPTVAARKINPLSNDLASIDYSLKPRENGKIMVLMYHNIGEKEEEWTRTPDNFRKDLQTLYEKGYRPIRLKDYVKGRIKTAAGFTPVIITVDDSRENNFRYLENGEIDPNCFIGIFLDFHKKHPDFPFHASFFSNGLVPFSQEGKEKEKLDFLIKNGMDIGNHTADHADFSSLNSDELQTSIGAQAAYLESIAPSGYKVNTLALPFGSRTETKYMDYLEKGTYKDHACHNIAILNVGWDPSYSPFHKDFNPLSIHRIRASEINVDQVGLYHWLDYFDQNPDQRFISDGQPHIVTVPKADLEEIQVPKGLHLNPYTPKN